MNSACVLVNGLETKNYQEFLKISGDFNYFVCVDVKMKAATTNSSISITAFTKSNRTIAIAVKNRWFHLGDNPLVDRYPIDKTANHYQLSPKGSLGLTET